MIIIYANLWPIYYGSLGNTNRWSKIQVSESFQTTGPISAHIQTRHNFVGEIRIFSVKICINPYPSFMHRCIAKTFTRFISRCGLPKKS